jgi:hypothetical protein
LIPNLNALFPPLTGTTAVTQPTTTPSPNSQRQPYQAPAKPRLIASAKDAAFGNQTTQPMPQDGITGYSFPD